MESLPTGLTGTTVGGGRFKRPEPDAVSADGDALLVAARDAITEPGAHLVFQDSGAVRTVRMTGDSMRIGRSLSADLRFEDPTVSRRHAVLVAEEEGVRVLDDRSLNGVFVNGERVEWRVLGDGDEIVVGRYRLHFLEAAPEITASETSPLEAAGS
jgi:pSer/pThr/pTyr-binding forkhead associated (FHA) protein